jgi:hypothetical protein
MDWISDILNRYQIPLQTLGLWFASEPNAALSTDRTLF